MLWGANRGKWKSHRESNPGHLWLEPPVLCHWAMTARQPPTLTTILYVYCTGGTECLSRAPAFFTFLYLRLITSNFIYFQLEARYSQHVNFIIPTRELLQPIISVIFNKEPLPILSLMPHPASPFPSLPQSFSPHITSGYRCHVHLQQGFICLQRMEKVLNLQRNLRDRR